MTRPALLFIALLILGGCEKDKSTENMADQVDNAANQSESNAADILHNTADEIRAGNVSGTPDDPEGTVQNALKNAANAQTPP